MDRFTLLLVESTVDVVIVGNPYCSICFEKKMNTKILNTYSITSKDYIELVRNGVNKGYNVKCVCEAQRDGPLCEAQRDEPLCEAQKAEPSCNITTQIP